MSDSFTKQYLFDELLRFRRMFRNKHCCLDALDKAFDGLTYVYFNTETETPEDDVRIETAYLSTANEWTTRRILIAPDILEVFEGGEENEETLDEAKASANSHAEASSA